MEAILIREIDESVFREIERHSPLGITGAEIAEALGNRNLWGEQVRRAVERLTRRGVIEKIQMSDDGFGRTVKRKRVLWRAVR